MSNSCVPNDSIEIPEKYRAALPITTKKYEGLVQLCKKMVIPERFHSFYENLKNGKDDSQEDFDDSD